MRFAFLVGFFLIVTFRQGFAESLGSAPSDVILVAATVDGQAGTFLLDTGTERSCLDAGFAARLAIASTSRETVREPYAKGMADGIRISKLGIGSFHLQNVQMLSTDLSPIFLKAGISIDGILGSDVLRHFVVRIDFASGSAQFGMSDMIPEGATVVKLQPVNDHYFVPVGVQGVPTTLLLDTGTNASSISSQAWLHITTHWKPTSVLDGVRSTGGSENTKFVLVPVVDIGRNASRNVPFRIQPQTTEGLFAETSFDGLLGTDILQHFVVTLDLANNKMYLVRNPNIHVNPYLFSTIGIQFAKDADGDFVIMAVWSPSPAAKAGLKVGDLILAVNQLDAEQLSLDDFSRKVHGRPGTEVHLVIDSGGRRHSVPVAIRCLLCPAADALEKAEQKLVTQH